MRKVLLIAAALSAVSLAAAKASTVSDPVGDFLPSFVGSHDPDLDVTSFSVGYNAAAQDFTLSATLAGPINPAATGLYAIGVNTGTGVIQPFAAIGEPNVIFNQVIVVQKSGAASVGANALSAMINGDMFSVVVPLADLPSTGFAADHYGFNLWPRVSLANNAQIADFAPDNATLAVAVPEPGGWALMMVGVAMVGFAMRRARGGFKAVVG